MNTSGKGCYPSLFLSYFISSTLENRTVQKVIMVMMKGQFFKASIFFPVAAMELFHGVLWMSETLQIDLAAVPLMIQKQVLCMSS